MEGVPVGGCPRLSLGVRLVVLDDAIWLISIIKVSLRPRPGPGVCISMCVFSLLKLSFVRATKTTEVE